MARTALDLLADDETRTKLAAGSRVLEQRSGSETYSLSDPRLGNLLNVLGPVGNAGIPVNDKSSLRVATVYACTRILAESVAMLPLKLYRKTADGREEASDHPLYRVVHREPDYKRQTSFEWREMLQGHLCLRGNAYARIGRNAFGDVVSLRPLHPDQVMPWEHERSGELFYRVSTKAGESQEFTANDILHVRGLSSDGITGLSPVKMLCDSIGQSLAARAHMGSSFKNGNRFPGYLSAAGQIKPGDAQLLADAWDKARTERNNKPPVLWGGLDWHSVGMNHQEAQIIEGLGTDVKDIASAYRIPMVMLAHGDKAATYASVEQFLISFANQTLQPWLERWEQRLGMQLLTTKEKDAGYYFAFNLKALLKGDAKSRAEFYKTMREIRAIKVNEIRAGEELDDLPDHIGDNVREGFNGQGGGADGDNQSTVTSNTTQDDEDDL